MVDIDLLVAAKEALRVGDAQKALRFVRAAAARIRDPFRREFAIAAIEIDAGAFLRDRRVIRRGISRMARIRPSVPSDALADYTYNLGNGYLALGEREQGRGPCTRPSLVRAVSHLEESLAIRESPETRTNLGSALASQGRWIEALDEFSSVLHAAPDHHNALAQHGRALIGLFNWSRNHKGLLVSALNDHIRAAELATDEPVYKTSYLAMVDRLRARIRPRNPSPRESSATAKWIWDNRLNLNLCPICQVAAPDAFDTFPLQGPILATRRRPSHDELLDIFNSLCRTFGIARWMLLRGLFVVPLEESDQIISIPSSTPARHDTSQALVLVAIAQFFSVFQQIAYGLSKYVHLGHADSAITFDRVWWSADGRHRGVPTARGDLHRRLRRTSSPALAALHHLALSMAFGLGKYSSLRELRNQIEHHIVVPVMFPHKSCYYHPYMASQLSENALQIGRLARAAIWYFAGTVLHFESERAKRHGKSGRPSIVMPGGSVERL